MRRGKTAQYAALLPYELDGRAQDPVEARVTVRRGKAARYGALLRPTG